MSFAPPPCRMPLGQSQDIPQADPGGMATPRFWHRLIRFRHVISGSLALASLNHACRSLVPTFPQRSPPSLFTTAACGGLRSTPDCRTRRALLHLSYSCVLPCGPAILLSCRWRSRPQHQKRTFIRRPRGRSRPGPCRGAPHSTAATSMPLLPPLLRVSCRYSVEEYQGLARTTKTVPGNRKTERVLSSRRNRD